MIVKPLGNRLLTKKIEMEAKTKSGIILDGKAVEKSCIAEVIEVGTGDNVRNFNIGDKVLYARHHGIISVVDEVKYLILRDDECLAVVYEEE